MKAKSKPDLEAQARAGAEAAKIMAEAMDRALGILREAGVGAPAVKSTTRAVGNGEGRGNFLTIKQVRDRLNLPHINTVYQMIREKKLPVHRVTKHNLRIDAADIDAYLESVKQKAATIR